MKPAVGLTIKSQTTVAIHCQVNPHLSGYRNWYPTGQAGCSQGGRSRKFMAFGMPGYMPFPSPWQSNQWGQPYPPPFGMPFFFSQTGSSSDGGTSGNAQPSGLHAQRGSESQKRPHPPTSPSPSDLSEVELDPLILSPRVRGERF